MKLISAKAMLVVISFLPVVPGQAQWNTVTTGLDYPFARFASIGRHVILGQAFVASGTYSSTDNGVDWSYKGLPAGVETILPFIAKNGDTLLLVATSAGLYVSGDFLGSFSLADSSLPKTIVSGLCSIKDNNYVEWLVAGTVGLGVFRSSDEGRSWSAANSGLTALNTAGVFSHNSSLFAADTGGGLFRSSDLGASWSKVDSTLTGCFAALDSVLFVGTSKGVYRSSDNGTSWAPSGLTDTAINVMAVLSHSAQDRNILVGTKFGVWRSPDAGLTWKEANGGLGRSMAGWNIIGLGVYDTAIFVGAMYSQGYNYSEGTFRSTDCGKAWAEPSVTANDDLSPDLQLHKVGDELYASQRLRVLKLIGHGEPWTGVFETTPPASCSGVSFGPDTGSDGIHMMAILSGGPPPLQNTAVRSSDGGSTWEEISLPPVGRKTIVPLGEKDSILFLDSHDVVINGNITDSVGGLLSSSDKGKTWSRSSCDELNKSLTNSYFVSFAVYPDPNAMGGRTIFIGTYASVFLSTDNGGSWMRDTDGVADQGIYSLVRWNDALYLRVSGTVLTVEDTTQGFPIVRFVCTPSQLLRWNPVLNNWAAIGGDLPVSASTTLSITQSSIRPNTSLMLIDGRDIMDTQTSQFISSNGGVNWEKLNTPYYGTYVSLLGDSLYEILGRSVVYAEIAGLLTSVGPVSVGTESSYVLSQNYPNPFNPTTTIRYGLPHRSHVLLTVYNTLGQKVAELVNNDVEAGYHEVQFEAHNLASGVYFYRLQAGSFAETKKFLLVR